MTISLIVVCSAVFALAAVILLVGRPRHSFFDREDLASQLRSINVAAFLNLVDPHEEAFLKHHLPSMIFRRIHRERMWAAMEYAWHAAHNARLLMQFAEMARRDSNHAIAVAAESLYQDALTCRVRSLRLLPRLALSAALPGRSELPANFADTYESLGCKFKSFSRLHVPVALSKAA